MVTSTFPSLSLPGMLFLIITHCSMSYFINSIAGFFFQLEAGLSVNRGYFFFTFIGVIDKSINCNDIILWFLFIILFCVFCSYLCWVDLFFFILLFLLCWLEVTYSLLPVKSHMHTWTDKRHGVSVPSVLPDSARPWSARTRPHVVIPLLVVSSHICVVSHLPLSSRGLEGHRCPPPWERVQVSPG